MSQTNLSAELQSLSLFSKDFGWNSNIYFGDIRCFLSSYLNFLQLRDKKPYLSIGYVWNEIESRQQDIKKIYENNKIQEFDRYISDQFFLMIPSRFHLWEFLFNDYNSAGIYEYINNSQHEDKNKGNKVDLETICKLNHKYFIGDQFNFDVYFNTDLLKQSIPENISLPYQHPLSNLTYLKGYQDNLEIDKILKVYSDDEE